MREARPKAHRLASPDLAIRQHQLCSGANRAHNLPSLVATRSESLPITSRAGNDRNASPGELDFMHGRMTRRHEGCGRTIPHRKRVEYRNAGTSFQGNRATKSTCKTTSAVA